MKQLSVLRRSPRLITLLAALHLHNQVSHDWRILVLWPLDLSACWPRGSYHSVCVLLAPLGSSCKPTNSSDGEQWWSGQHNLVRQWLTPNAWSRGEGNWVHLPTGRQQPSWCWCSLMLYSEWLCGAPHLQCSVSGSRVGFWTPAPTAVTKITPRSNWVLFPFLVPETLAQLQLCQPKRMKRTS